MVALCARQNSRKGRRAVSKKRANLTGFSRADQNPFQRRLDMVLGREPEDLGAALASAFSDDIDEYVPKFEEVFDWMHEAVLENTEFEGRNELADVSLDMMEEILRNEGLPAELVTWARAFDWEGGFLDAYESMPKHEKADKFLDMFFRLIAANKGNIEGSVENIVNDENPETGQSWHAARAACAFKVATNSEFSAIEYILDNIGTDDFEDYDLLYEKLSKVKPLNDFRQSIFEIGWVYRDYWWRQNHGDAAREYYGRVDEFKAREEGRAVGTNATKEKATKMRDKVADLIQLAVNTKGMAFAFASPDVQASTVREIAAMEFYEDFSFRKGELVSVSWFRERIEDMRATGELASIAERAMKEA